MRPGCRSAVSLLAGVVMTLTLTLGPSAQAQSPAPSPAASPLVEVPSPAPDLMCGLLTTDEVGQALGFPVTIASGSVFDCTWQGDVNAGNITGLSASVESGTMQYDVKAVFPGGADLTIGDSAAYALVDSLWVEVSGRILLLQVLFASPEAADPLPALTALATIAVARFDSLAIPDEASSSPLPQPSFLGDIELKDRFPTEIAGKPVDVTSITGQEARARANAKTRKILDQLVAALKPQGKTLDDVSVGFAVVISGATGAQVVALRVRGADATALEPLVMPLLVASFLPTFGKPQQSTAQVEGRDVIVLKPAKKSPDAGHAYAYVYAHDEVVWLVAGPGDGTDAVVTEVFQKLP